MRETKKARRPLDPEYSQAHFPVRLNETGALCGFQRFIVLAVVQEFLNKVGLAPRLR